MGIGRTSRAAWALASLLLATRVAHADEEPSETATFRYAQPAKKHYFRAAVEVSALLVGGYIQYRQEGANSRDWDLDYDWPSFRKKLIGEAMTFDTNHFDTNMLTHPVSGGLYYLAARSNRLDILESALYAAAASTFWEYVGEFREKVSVNDMIVTPIAGIAVGESLTQLGAYFDRGSGNAFTQTLAFLFGPAKSIHDRIDGAEPWRSPDTDALGLSREGGHALEITAGLASTFASAAPTARVDTNVGLRTFIVNVPEYGRPTRSSRFLTDGNVSTITTDATFGNDGLTDLLLSAQVAPVGWYAQSSATDRVFIGTSVGFDYALHRYDRDRASASDAISGVHAGALTFACDGALGPLRVRTSLDARPTFAAVHADARDAYVASGGSVDALPTVTRNEGYYFAFGATIAPRVEIAYRGLRAGGEARVDEYWAIGGLDRDQSAIHTEASMSDWRELGKAWAGFAPDDRLLLSVALIERARGGRVNDHATSRRESTLLTSITAVF